VNEATDVVAVNDLQKFLEQIEKEVFPNIQKIFLSQMEMLNSLLQKKEYKNNYYYINFVSKINSQIRATFDGYSNNISHNQINYNANIGGITKVEWLQNYLEKHSEPITETSESGLVNEIPAMPTKFKDVCNNFFETVEMVSKFSNWHQNIQKALNHHNTKHNLKESMEKELTINSNTLYYQYLENYEGPEIRQTCSNYQSLISSAFSELKRQIEISNSFKQAESYWQDMDYLKPVTHSPSEYYKEKLERDENLLKAKTFEYLRKNYPFLVDFYEGPKSSSLQNYEKDGMLSDEGKGLFNFLGGSDEFGDESNFKNLLSQKPEEIYSKLTNQPNGIFYKVEGLIRDQRVLDKAYSIQSRSH
jgi:hypothetical protein